MIFGKRIGGLGLDYRLTRYQTDSGHQQDETKQFSEKSGHIFLNLFFILNDH
ncbi:MAG: hypothetical protein Q7U30_18830 [Methylicorpusculum sp.]|nr:hypothetical protein [Methylicorpusculum sp.]